MQLPPVTVKEINATKNSAYGKLEEEIGTLKNSAYGPLPKPVW